MSRRSRGALLALFGSLWGLSAFSQSLPAGGREPSFAAAISTSRRFVVTGMTAEENADLASAADEVSRKLEQAVGRPLPVGLAPPLGIQIRRNEKEPRGRVIKAQGWVDHRLEQKLIVIRLEQVGQEDILEGLCGLLLNRYVIAQQPAADRVRRLGTAPDWLSVGLAQNSYATLRARNSRAVLKLWHEGNGYSLAEVTGWQYLPEGLWSEKAFAAMVVDWLSSQGGGAAGWDRIFRRCAEGRAVDADWIAAELLQAGNAREAEQRWDVWIAHQTEIQRSWGQVSESQVSALRDLFVVQPAQLGIPPGTNVPVSLALGDLPRYRDQPWFLPLIVRLELKIRSLGIAQPTEYQAVIARYADYLKELTSYPKKSFWYRLFHRPPHEATLLETLRRADEGLARLEQSMQERAQYLDGIEQPAADPEPPFSRASLQQYVDEVERRQP